MKKLSTIGLLLLSSTALIYTTCAQEKATAPTPAAAPASTTPAAAAPAAPVADAAAPAAAGDTTARVVLGAQTATMKFDKTEFTVKPGQKVMLLFKNDKCPLQHNILIGKPGSKDKIGAASDKMLADPNALKNNYFPSIPEVLFKGTKLVGLGQTDLMEFTAPTDEGDYPYVCTFPAHWRTMNGVMKVAK